MSVGFKPGNAEEAWDMCGSPEELFSAELAQSEKCKSVSHSHDFPDTGGLPEVSSEPRKTGKEIKGARCGEQGAHS